MVASARQAKHSAASVEWYTPPAIVEAARSLMGRIDLDPASCKLAQRRIVKATRWIDKDGTIRIHPSTTSGDAMHLTGAGGGLAWHWSGSVFLNPPGGRTSTGTGSSAVEWWDKLVYEYDAGRVTQAIFVGFTVEILQTSQSARKACVDFPVCIPSERVKFWRTPTDAERAENPHWPADALVEDRQPTHANAIVYLPPKGGAFHANRFRDAFGAIGRIMLPFEP